MFFCLFFSLRPDDCELKQQIPRINAEDGHGRENHGEQTDWQQQLLWLADEGKDAIATERQVEIVGHTDETE